MIERKNMEVVELDDIREKGITRAFTRFPSIVENVTFLVLSTLAKNGKICMRQRVLAKIVGVCEQRLKNTLAKLEEKGHIKYSVAVAKSGDSTSLCTYFEIL